MSKVLIITALADIGRGNLQEGFGRSFGQYLNALNSFLTIPCDKYVFLEENLLEKYTSNIYPNTKFLPIQAKSIQENFKYFEETEKIRLNPQWAHQAAWLPDSPQAKLPLYNPLVMQKMDFLHQVWQIEKDNYSHIFWLDAGIAQTVHPGYFTHDLVLQKIPDFVNKFALVCYPYFGNTEIHGFERKAIAEYANTDYVDRVARGGFFGGSVQSIDDIFQAYHHVLKATLKAGYMGTEESIFSILTYVIPQSVQVFYIEANGLLSTFFEGVKNNLVNTKMPEIPSSTIQISINDLENWHRNCDMHWMSALYTTKNYLKEKQNINFLDIGSSTGKFYELLNVENKIQNAVFIDPLQEALTYAESVFQNTENIEYFCGIPSPENDELFLHIFDSHDGNLGIFTIGNYPDFNTRSIEGLDKAKLLQIIQKLNPHVIRIHSGNFSLPILETILNGIQSLEFKPFLFFDYGFYDSREKLAAALAPFENLGYGFENPFAWGGGDFFLTPGLQNKHAALLSVTLPDELVHAEKSTLFTTTPALPRSDVNTYIVTYNLPKQLGLLLQSFRIAGNYLLYNTNLILIDNSDDENTKAVYQEMAETHHMEILRFGNLGISGARQLAADHFHQSGAEFMFFFEDDMLLCGPGMEVCKNGLPRFIPDLFAKSIALYRAYNFSFLKLCYTEFFGDNGTQWAWHNLPADKRRELFPTSPEKTEDATVPLTEFGKPIFKEGLVCVTGDIYYSNWPHLIGKKASLALFNETRWHFPAEATWMSHFYQLTREKKINPALLLATPINHHRAYHYQGESRREFGENTDFTKPLIGN